MGIIKAVKQAIGGGFADTWQEVIQTALSFMYMTISL